MKKLILCLFMLTAFALAGQSQNNPDTQPGKKKACCFKVSSLSISSGMYNYRTITREDKGFDFQKPQKGQNQNMFNFGNMGSMMGNNNGNMNSANSRKRLTLEIGLNPFSKKLGDYNKKRELDIGLYYSGSDLINENSTKIGIMAGDTFSNNSVMYRTDTLTRSMKSRVEKANVLGVSVQYLYKTDPEKRISLFTGYGINAAYAITARIHTKTISDTAVVVNYFSNKPGFDGFDNGNLIGGVEKIYSRRADPTIFAGVYIPFGINFRLCKAKDIWNQMYIFLKGNMGLETELVVAGEEHSKSQDGERHSNTRVQLNPYMGGSIGFRFNFK